MDRPNILIIMTDHQRGDTILPEHPCQTPNVSRLCGEGVTFTEAFCPSPHCCPARATFFTGLYPSMHGVWNNICNGQRLSRGLNPGVRTWSADVAAAGYVMRFSGKWHVSIDEDPKDCGWGELSPAGSKGVLHGQTWEHYQKLAAKPDDTKRGEGEILRPGYGTYRLYGTNEQGNRHDVNVTQQVVDALPGLAKEKEPWCVFAGLTGPHDPYCVPSAYLDLYRIEDIPLPPSYADEMRDKPGLYQRMRDQIWSQLSPREIREGIRHFWAYCSWLDDLAGQMLNALEATGQAENTLVVYTSDHGDYCGDHGLFCKSIPCFRGAYHVPMVMRWPRGIRNPGRRVDAFAGLADCGPTFMDLAGASADRHFMGRSLVPFLQNEPPADWRDAIYTQCNGVEVYATQRSIATRTHKYVFNAFDRDELYDLTQDPHEMQNRSADPAYADVKRALCGRLWQFAHEEGDTATNAYITIGLAPYGPAEAFR